MTYRHYKVVDFKPGELVDGSWHCLPTIDYADDDNVIWLMNEAGRVMAFETIGHDKEFKVNCIIEYGKTLFKAAIRDGHVHLMHDRCKWLSRN